MRYFLQISYKGNRYRGWQRQANATGCIQEIIEKAIARTFRKEYVTIYGCGRTDAGVHASKYFAHLDWEDDTLPNYLTILNHNLPIDIIIHKIIPMHDDAHARYDARSRTYIYHFHFFPDAFKYELSTYYELQKPLDVISMQSACELILKQTEFKHFCKTPLKHKSTDCYVTECRVAFSEEQTQGFIQISANRFLKSMVRILVAEIMEIGQGFQAVEDLNKIFQNGRENVDKIAYPQGLFLKDVWYEYEVK